MQICQLAAAKLGSAAAILPGIPSAEFFPCILYRSFDALSSVEQYVSSEPIVLEYASGMPLLILYEGEKQQAFYLDRLLQIAPNVPFSITALSDSCAVYLRVKSKDSLRVLTTQPAPSLPGINSELKLTRLYTFFYQECAGNFYFRGEQHAAYELVYVDRGEIHNLVGGKDIVLGQQQFMLIGSNEWHTQYSDQPVSFLTVSFLAQNDALAALCEQAFSPSQRETNLLRQMLEEYTQTAYSYDCVESLLRLFLIELLRNASAHPLSPSTHFPATTHTEHLIVDYLIQEISSTSARPLSLSQLAASAHISVTYMHRLFQTHLGMPPGTYIRKIRIEESKILIRGGTLSMGEIAKQLGFSSQQHFSRQFRAVTGMTPSEYTRLLR